MKGKRRLSGEEAVQRILLSNWVKVSSHIGVAAVPEVGFNTVSPEPP